MGAVSNDPFKGSPKNTGKHIYIMVHKNSKLQFWSSNEDNLWLGVNITRGAVLKGHRVKRLRTTVCHTHRFFGCTFFLSAGLLTDVNYILVKQLTQKKNLQQQREAKVRKKKKQRRRKLRPEDDKLLGLHSGNQCFKNWNRMAKEREEKQEKRFSWQLSQNTAKTSDLT